MMNNLGFQCPTHQTRLLLDKQAEEFVCNDGCVYPIINHIPRFVSSNNYAKAFGSQWKYYQKTQLDSYTGRPISHDRLERLVGGDLSIVAGKLVLEAGCGAGRFTEILLRSGATVYATDLSNAVEANYDNCHHEKYYSVFQANLLSLPVASGQFDIVFCVGVIQHTPNPEETIKALSQYVKPGGMLVMDHYPYNYPFTFSRKWLRKFLIQTPPSFSFKFCRALVAFLWPMHRLLWKYKKYTAINKLRGFFIKISPVVDYHDFYAELGPDLLYAWAMLDTHDTLTDFYKHLRTIEQIANALKLAGMEDIQTAYAGNGVEARARKPGQKD